MTLYKALKILLKLGEKETIVLGFKDWHGYTAFNTIRYLAEAAGQWEVKSKCSDICKVRAEAYGFMTKYLAQGKQIWVKQSTCDLYNV